MHVYLLLFDDVAEAFDDDQAEEVAELDIGATVRLVLLLDGGEVEVNGEVVAYFARVVEQLADRGEDVMIAAVVEELDLAHELQPDALVLDLAARLLELDVDLIAFGAIKFNWSWI